MTLFTVQDCMHLVTLSLYRSTSVSSPFPLMYWPAKKGDFSFILMEIFPPTHQSESRELGHQRRSRGLSFLAPFLGHFSSEEMFQGTFTLSTCYRKQESREAFIILLHFQTIFTLEVPERAYCKLIHSEEGTYMTLIYTQ